MDSGKYGNAHSTQRAWTSPSGYHGFRTTDAAAARDGRPATAATLAGRSARELSAVSADAALSATDTDVDLSGHQLAASEAACLAKLALFGTVSRLCVAGCGLADAHFQSFLPTLRLAGVRVSQLDVSHNVLGSGGARALAAYVSSEAGRSTHTLRIR